MGHEENTAITADDKKVSAQMRAYWANFARTGDPNGPNLPRWPVFTVKSQDYLPFPDSGAAAKSGMRRKFCEVFVLNLKSHMDK